MYRGAGGDGTRTAFSQRLLAIHMLDSHTTTEDVGRIAAIAKPKVLVLSHLIPGDDMSITDDQWAEGVKRHFSGNVIVARDLMELALPLR